MSKTRERLVKLILSADDRPLHRHDAHAAAGDGARPVRTDAADCAAGTGPDPCLLCEHGARPGWGAAVGGLADLLGYFVNPFGGAFFLPITLAAAAAIPALSPAVSAAVSARSPAPCTPRDSAPASSRPFAGDSAFDPVFRPVLAAACLHAHYERRVRGRRVRAPACVWRHGRTAEAASAFKKLAGFS